MENMGSEGVDKLLGLTFGLVQGVFICLTFTALLTMQPLVDTKPLFENSIIGSRFIQALPEVKKILPESDLFKNNIGIDA